MKTLPELAESLRLSPDKIIPFGHDKAKVDLSVMKEPRKSANPAKLILVSAITPTPAGEGKTTTTIGLGDALTSIGESVCLALREPSLGPCFGMKGGGTGGGKARLHPSDDINLHFTGDFHAITSAHNLLAAAIDNHLHFDSELGIEGRKVVWPRVIDMNDRGLRKLVLGLGGKASGVPRESGFDITAASELMAMLCLAEDHDDLRTRIDRALIGFGKNGSPITAGQIGVTGAMLALLRDVIHPNLVQTQHGTPALVHGGPFANIAHGCNSVIATRMAMHLSDWVITEAGFGFDLGAEKFYDIKCRGANLNTAAVVLVASLRALKMHGGRRVDELNEPDPTAVGAGLPNLAKHLESIRHFGQRPVVAINRFAADTEEEITVLRKFCEEQKVPVAICSHFAEGAQGAVELAKAVRETARVPDGPIRPLYELSEPVPEKIRKVARAIYGAEDVVFSKAAEKDLELIGRLGYADLPVCIAKTQNSLSDNPKLRGRPRDFEITVRNLQINAGAGFIVVLTGDILRMPGLPRAPQAQRIDLADGTIVGLR